VPNNLSFSMCVTWRKGSEKSNSCMEIKAKLRSMSVSGHETRTKLKKKHFKMISMAQKCFSRRVTEESF
jgi:hypothetical protein